MGAANPFMGFMGAGLGNVFGMMGPAGPGFGAFDNSGVMGGWGFGSWNPLAHAGPDQQHEPATTRTRTRPRSPTSSGRPVPDRGGQGHPHDHADHEEDGRGHRASGQYINSSSSSRTAAAAARAAAARAPSARRQGRRRRWRREGSPSIDVETMKLKRLVDKRSQMFDMLRQIIDKYNETAKGIIQSIGR
jgi:hypothetical protein